MISLKNKTILINDKSKDLNDDIINKLNILGASVIIMSQHSSVNNPNSSYKLYYYKDTNEMHSILENILYQEKIDSYIHFNDIINVDSFLNQLNENNLNEYIDIIKLLSNPKCSNDNISIVNISKKNALPEYLAKQLSIEFIKEDIRINHILLTKSSNKKDINNIILFLISDSAKYIIGENYYIN